MGAAYRVSIPLIQAHALIINRAVQAVPFSLISRDSKLMAVAIEAHGATLQPGAPRELFQTRIMSAGSRPQYDVAPDGRFLINTEVEEADGQPIHLLLNWNPPEN